MASHTATGRRLRVGVDGGAISGCAVAIELIRAGHVVDVFERSPGALIGRGAGIGTPTATLRSLAARDLVDADLPRCHSTKMRFVSRGASGHPHGQTAWAPDYDFVSTHWDHLYRALRRRVPDAAYHAGRTVVDARALDPDTVGLRFADGTTPEFDLVVFADGYQSLGRRLLFPDLEPQYCGYVAWRGVVDERHVAEPARLESALTRVIFPDLPGHLILYFVPGPRGSVAPSERTVNWVAYVAMPPAELPRFLTDRHGHRHAHSLPPGRMRPEEEARLQHLLRAQLPPAYAQIVAASRDTFAQPIYRAEPPAYHRGRMCLIGDAGALVPPVTGSGVLRGMTNAIDLVAALGDGDERDMALANWDAAQTALGRRLSTLSRQIEAALIWATPDLAQLDAAAVEAWYNGVVSLRPLSTGVPPASTASTRTELA